jgi:hypothetical protein
MVVVLACSISYRDGWCDGQDTCDWMDECLVYRAKWPAHNADTAKSKGPATSSVLGRAIRLVVLVKRTLDGRSLVLATMTWLH